MEYDYTPGTNQKYTTYIVGHRDTKAFREFKTAKEANTFARDVMQKFSISLHDMDFIKAVHVITGNQNLFPETEPSQPTGENVLDFLARTATAKK